MTSFVKETSYDGQEYLGDNYVSTRGKRATDALITTVKYVSVCPRHTHVYHFGMYCCAYEKVANGTSISRRSPIKACLSTQRMRCPTISWYKKTH